jgi:hypothetical protein
MSEPKTVRVTEEDRERARRLLVEINYLPERAGEFSKRLEERRLVAEHVALALATARAECAAEMKAACLAVVRSEPEADDAPPDAPCAAFVQATCRVTKRNIEKRIRSLPSELAAERKA